MILTAWISVGPASAQTIYRVVGPDGKVSFSDNPPANIGNATTQEIGANAADNANPALPFALRQIVAKYPVTLYSADNCGPCGSGRTLLISRGVPFTEKTVNTNDDAEALQRISGTNTIPFATIGGQQLKGYSDSEWTQFLNAAGYPKTSALPANYKNPAATPLVVVKKPATPTDVKEATAAPRARSTPAPDTSKNPAGIRF
ncbi:glutaredoxin family protein [Rhodoferax sp. PAMC 29310]|uniref:glutaredoxin family protein n=1 Tax=Rhodoferax sp. PAMC 29310 TaxID=2822760 RepID=UPI001F0A5ED9|nr:glutaredoxin family protein [Rhodoferax sp. PAMC 29310]